MDDLGEISRELQNEPEDLRRSIIKGVAKLKSLDLLTGANAFQRDGARLDAKSRAVYRQQGLDVEPDETITNIIADNITTDKKRDGISPLMAAALTGGALLAGVVGAALLPDSASPDPPAVNQRDYELGLLPPDE